MSFFFVLFFGSCLGLDCLCVSYKRKWSTGEGCIGGQQRDTELMVGQTCSFHTKVGFRLGQLLGSAWHKHLNRCTSEKQTLQQLSFFFFF